MPGGGNVVPQGQPVVISMKRADVVSCVPVTAATFERSDHI